MSYNRVEDRDRFQRNQRRTDESWKRERLELIKKNSDEVNILVSRFKAKKLRLVRNASIGNPIRAVSSAVSCPEHMCQALLVALSSILQTTPSDTECVKYELKGSTLIMKKIKKEPIDSIDVIDKNVRIEVQIGDVQRAMEGHASDHRCKGLCCNDIRHGFTRITVPTEMIPRIDNMLVENIIDVAVISIDHRKANISQTFTQFHPSHHKNSPWANRVYKEARTCLYPQVYTVWYLDNELTGLPYIIASLFETIFRN